MILKQFYLDCLSQASYLIGDEETGGAAVVDPRRDVEVYLEEAARLGLEIRHVLLTHFHADFVAGHLELRERTGAVIHLGAGAQADYPFEEMREGQSLPMGRVRLDFLQTPGHTPEGICILVYDLAKSAEKPHAVLTGDTLFIGDVGRPDLMASQGVTAEELAAMLYRSTREKLLPLPDETLVYPAHGAGSACGKNLSTETVSTIGQQRQFNYALQPMPEADFIKMVTADQPPPPAYFAFDADLNRRERPTLAAALASALRPLGLEQFLEQQAAGAQVVDTRDPGAFAAGHLAGSLGIGLGGRFAEWAGRVLERGKPILVVALPGMEQEAATRLGRIGFDFVAGYLEGGPQAFAARPDLVRRVERFSPAALAAALEGAGPPLVLDVRGAGERELASIPGSVHIPLPDLPARAGELPRDRRIVTHCAGGYRSMLAASILENQGISDPADLAGGIAAWQEAAPLKS